MTKQNQYTELRQRLKSYLETLYPNQDVEKLSQQCIEHIGLDPALGQPQRPAQLWSEQDALLITYGNTFVQDQQPTLKTLHAFCNTYLRSCISTIHILPFFPYSSDDGFSVIDYRQVDPQLGTWQDISAISQDFCLMADLVINHCSSSSQWFKNFTQGKHPGADYFIDTQPDLDTSAVVRPRVSPLLRPTETNEGIKYVWCTFSHDQVDLDFSNPNVLLEFLDIIRLYLATGSRWFRLDAVAFAWKKPGTTCINLPETHQLIRLLRLLIEHKDPNAVVITETNIPNQENLTYFGNADEAHIIYNFSLPPLLVNTLITGNCQHLNTWLASMPQPQQGTTYLNFIASHDGIGLRPVEGLLSDQETNTLVDTMRQFGGQVSGRALSDGTEKPYEINISLWNALSGTATGEADGRQFERFICAHAIMFSLQGVPAIYVQSFLATHNDTEAVERRGEKRAINRHQWRYSDIQQQLSNGSHHEQVLNTLKHLLMIRKTQPAMHPNAQQTVQHVNDAVFVVSRHSIDQQHRLMAIFNVSQSTVAVKLADLNLHTSDTWIDAIEGTSYSQETASIQLAPYQFIWLTNNANQN